MKASREDVDNVQRTELMRRVHLRIAAAKVEYVDTVGLLFKPGMVVQWYGIKGGLQLLTGTITAVNLSVLYVTDTDGHCSCVEAYDIV